MTALMPPGLVKTIRWARPGWRIARRTVGAFLAQEGMQWSGAVAFFLVLSVPPLVIAASSIAAFITGEGAARDVVVERLGDFLPVRQGIIEQIAEQTVNASGVAAVASIAFLLFSGTRVFAALIAAIHVMWGHVEDPGFVRVQATRLGLLVSVGGLFVVAGALDVIVAFAGSVVPVPTALRWLIDSHVVPAVLSASGLFVVFFLIPRRAATWRTALIGAAVGAVLLRLAQVAFTGYLMTFGGFESAYGPLASIAIIMTWALVASGAIILAAHLVAVLNASPHGDAKSAAGSGVPGTAGQGCRSNH